MRLLACLIVAPQRGYDEPAILSYAISSFCPTSADGLQDCPKPSDVCIACLSGCPVCAFCRPTSRHRENRASVRSGNACVVCSHGGARGVRNNATCWRSGRDKSALWHQVSSKRWRKRLLSPWRGISLRDRG